MAAPYKPVSLTAEEVEAITRKLADMRHNVNNYLSLITAATEIVRRKPEAAQRMMTTVGDQPPKIIAEIRTYSNEVDRLLRLTQAT